MFKIGDFSKLVQVSVKTLRYYGKLELLKPAWIDRYSGYRYYTLEELPRLNRILALKDLGFSLEQIRELLRDDLSAAELRGMMRMKHAELERQVQSEQARLVRVEARLRQIEQEGAMPEYEVVLKCVPPQNVVGIRDVISGYLDMGGLINELHAYLGARHVALEATQPFMAVYYDTEHHDRGIDVEVAAALPRPLPGTGRAFVHTLPGAETMACAVHQGSYQGLSAVYNALMSWIKGNGYRVTGPNRDVYLQVPGSEPDATGTITEVQFPVEKKPVSTFVIHHKEKMDMEPKIVSRPAFSVVGMLYHGKNENNEIAQMWGEFNPRFDEVKHMINLEAPAYGVCNPPGEDGAFDYIAGFELSSTAAPPEGMLTWDVPDGKYAVFPCTLKTIGQAYQHAFETWLPGSGYQRVEAPDFELYDENFDPQEEGSVLYIYIPIK